MRRKTWLLPLPLSALASQKVLARVTRSAAEAISRPAPIAAEVTSIAQTAGKPPPQACRLGRRHRTDAGNRLPWEFSSRWTASDVPHPSSVQSSAVSSARQDAKLRDDSQRCATGVKARIRRTTSSHRFGSSVARDEQAGDDGQSKRPTEKGGADAGLAQRSLDHALTQEQRRPPPPAPGSRRRPLAAARRSSSPLAARFRTTQLPAPRTQAGGSGRTPSGGCCRLQG